MKLTVVQYLVKKLKTLGIKNVFGLPGDYNFNILDAVIKEKDIEWTNCTNELNAGYASDGYARINGYGAVVTTYGVGELSAINAIAGSYAENVPVIHIAGVPKTSFIKNNVVVHHNFANADYFVFENIYKNVCAAAGYLTFENAKEEIDRVIDTMANTKQPVYLAIPIDVCCHCIDDEGFDKINYKKSDEKNLKLAAEEIISLVDKSCSPVLFLDYLTKRFNLQNEILKFIDKTDMKFSAFLMGKGAISEKHKNFIGINTGNFSNQSLIDEVKNSDLIITAGFLNADLNTGGFTVFCDRQIDIKIEKTKVIIKDKTFENVLIQDIFPYLTEKINKKFNTAQITHEKAAPVRLKGKITVDDIFPYLEQVLDKGDILVVETGLMSLSGAFINLKPDMEYLSQTLWGSIGWATPAAFGAMRAGAEKGRNLVLYTGEGAHQLTFQEVANYFEHDLKPVIFVLNNDGYTVERVLSKDPLDKFNDITNWDYLKLTEALSAGRDYFKASVSTLEEFSSVIEKIKEFKGKKLCYVEVKTDKMNFTKLGPALVSNMSEFSRGLE